MGRGPAPTWNARKPPILDHYIWASINQAGGLGRHHPTTGHYADLVINDLADRDEAAEYKKALHRCAFYLHRKQIAAVSMRADKPERRPDGTYSIRFRVVDKTFAKAAVLARYGNDRSKWPYDPRRRSALWIGSTLKSDSPITRPRVTRPSGTPIFARTPYSLPGR